MKITRKQLSHIINEALDDDFGTVDDEQTEDQTGQEQTDQEDNSDDNFLRDYKSEAGKSAIDEFKAAWDSEISSLGGGVNRVPSDSLAIGYFDVSEGEKFNISNARILNHVGSQAIAQGANTNHVKNWKARAISEKSIGTGYSFFMPVVYNGSIIVNQTNPHICCPGGGGLYSADSGGLQSVVSCIGSKKGWDYQYGDVVVNDGMGVNWPEGIEGWSGDAKKCKLFVIIKSSAAKTNPPPGGCKDADVGYGESSQTEEETKRAAQSVHYASEYKSGIATMCNASRGGGTNVSDFDRGLAKAIRYWNLGTALGLPVSQTRGGGWQYSADIVKKYTRWKPGTVYDTGYADVPAMIKGEFSFGDETKRLNAWNNDDESYLSEGAFLNRWRELAGILKD